MTENRCAALHKFYVADVAVVQAEGKVCILAICQGCGKSVQNDHYVAKPASQIKLETRKEI